MEDLINMKNAEYNGLLNQIGNLLSVARTNVAKSVNTILLDTYWQIGKHIVEFEQNGKEKAEYGSNLINRLSADLTSRFGKGFGKSNLLYIRKFYLAFQKSETVSHKLSWSHYFEILKVDDPLEMSFYINQCEKDGWNVRELKRQMKSMLFHRIALNKDKTEVLELASNGIDVQKPETT